jgi:hypothetical protein
MLVNARTPGLRLVRSMLPRKLPMPWHPPAIIAARAEVSPPERLPRQLDPLRAVFATACPIERDDVFLKLCTGLVHLRDVAVHHALDRQNDLSPQREPVLYRDLAKMVADTTKALGITGEPRQVREQVHDHLVAAFEGVYDANVDADLRAREWEDALIRVASGVRVLRTAASLIERDVAVGDLNWLPGRTPTYPPCLLINIEYLWRHRLRRKAGMSVDARGDAGGPFVRFAVACLELLRLPAKPNAVRQAILRDRERRKKRKRR